MAYGKIDGYDTIRLLSKDQKHFTIVGGYYELFKRYPEEAFFLAKLTYSEKLTGGCIMETIVPVSFDEFRMTLDYSEESSLTHYRLQKLPEKLDKIEKALNQISGKLGCPPSYH